MGSYEDRGYHADRRDDFRLCPDERLETMHTVTRAAYLGALVGSVVLTGPLAAAATFVMMPVGALYSSAAERVSVGNGGAKVAGEAPAEPVQTREVLFDVAERLLPLLLFR